MSTTCTNRIADNCDSYTCGAPAVRADCCAACLPATIEEARRRVMETERAATAARTRLHELEEDDAPEAAAQVPRDPPKEALPWRSNGHGRRWRPRADRPDESAGTISDDGWIAFVDGHVSRATTEDPHAGQPHGPETGAEGERCVDAALRAIGCELMDEPAPHWHRDRAVVVRTPERLSVEAAREAATATEALLLAHRRAEANPTPQKRHEARRRMPKSGNGQR